MTPLSESLPVIQKEHYSGSFSFPAFFPRMFADCLITSLGFGTHTLQIHDRPSHYLHIFPLRIIIALTTTAHVLTSCRPGHTEVIISWKWSCWVSVVRTISNKQDEVGRFPSPPLLSGSKITFPLCHHSAMQDAGVVYVLLKSELALNAETRPWGCWIVSAFPWIIFLSTYTSPISWLNFIVYKMGFIRCFKNLRSSNLRRHSLRGQHSFLYWVRAQVVE